MALEDIIQKKEQNLKTAHEYAMKLYEMSRIIRVAIQSGLEKKMVEYNEQDEIQYLTYLLYEILGIHSYNFSRVYCSMDACVRIHNNWYFNILQQEQDNYCDYLIQSYDPNSDKLTQEEIKVIKNRNNSIKQAQEFEEIREKLFTLLLSEHQIRFNINYNFDQGIFQVEEIGFQRRENFYGKFIEQYSFPSSQLDFQFDLYILFYIAADILYSNLGYYITYEAEEENQLDSDKIKEMVVKCKPEEETSIQELRKHVDSFSGGQKNEEHSEKIKAISG